MVESERAKGGQVFVKLKTERRWSWKEENQPFSVEYSWGGKKREEREKRKRET